MKIKKVCEHCGSQAVRIEAYAQWDFDAQSWELLSRYEHSWCYDCDADTNIINREVEETLA
jgi:hypothetical protein